METSQTQILRADGSPRDVKAARLKEEFRARGRAGAGGALLLWSTDALELVDRAADEGVPIVRITCSTPTGGAVADQCADFTREVCDGHGCWEAADAFIRRRGELGMLFNIELGDDPLEIV
jgi:hypothetical protein